MTGRGKTCIWFLVGLAAIVAGFWRTLAIHSATTSGAHGVVSADISSG